MKADNKELKTSPIETGKTQIDAMKITRPVLPGELSGGVGTAIVDPPWDIDQKGKSTRSAASHYNLMGFEAIKAMPINLILKDDAFVWVWFTDSTLFKADELLEAWGLTRRGLFKWIKPNKLGLGNWLRHGCEYCVLATKGKPTIKTHSQIDYGIFSSLGVHSAKPNEMYAIAERCGDGPYLEMFARRPYKGWAKWGNEVESDIVLPGYPVPRYSKAVTDGEEVDCAGCSPEDEAWVLEQKRLLAEKRKANKTGKEA
ncbi:MT-A70 family methyltransferase [Enterocloster clostridioformis]|uniref:MT-A70 family methyltransferase n=1 Tax=Enterocloster clostridioformis TaxID=1531 RepID=UPI0008EA92E6|nr:MT-A70 family methyltransferase [Enterocloster clostridioformis]SFG86836.1 N6-adenosine-specific RNA methylase IME4 [Enterocloster clostridioformis]